MITPVRVKYTESGGGGSDVVYVHHGTLLAFVACVDGQVLGVIKESNNRIAVVNYSNITVLPCYDSKTGEVMKES